MRLFEAAHVGVALQCPVFRHDKLAVDRTKDALVPCGLWPSVGRAPITLQQFDGSGRDHAEGVRRSRERKVYLVAIVAPAEIGEHPRELARRVLPPAPIG